jgi:hypothetical protein
MSVPYGTFRLAITPLLTFSPDFDESDYVFVEQFADAQFSHPLNDSRTASVSLSMHDPIVENLRPYEQAAVLYYVRPNVDPAEAERILWGQCNVIDNYADGTVQLDIQDPAIRLQHHYLRVGDEALNDPRYQWRGLVTQDDRGIYDIVKGGYMVTVDAPLLGLAMRQRMTNRSLTKQVERGQEVWQTIKDLSELIGGPDFDLKPNHDPTGYYPTGGSIVSDEWKCYATLNAYNPAYSENTPQLMRDMTADVIFEYGQPSDNITTLAVTPMRPTTDVILVDSVQSIRTRGIAVAERHTTGDWQDWVSTGEDMHAADWAIPEERAIMHLRAYANCLPQIDLELRPDTGQDYFYGDPESPASPVVGDFYVGDLVTVRAVRGYRSFEYEYRVTQVDLGMDGSRAPITTKLTLTPKGTEIEPVVETDETVGTQQH